MGRLSPCAASPSDRCSSGQLGGLREGDELGQLRRRRWVVSLGLEQVEAELVAVYGRPPHLHARLAVPRDDLVVSGVGPGSTELLFDLHVSELPAELQAALHELLHRPAAASVW